MFVFWILRGGSSGGGAMTGPLCKEVRRMSPSYSQGNVSIIIIPGISYIAINRVRNSGKEVGINKQYFTEITFSV